MNCYVTLRYGINFRTSCGQVADYRVVAVGSRRGPRLAADRSPTIFNDSNASILTKLVGDRSATDRGLATKSFAASFCELDQKPGCD